MESTFRFYHPNLVITTPRLILRDCDYSERCCKAIHRMANEDAELRATHYFAVPTDLKDMRQWLTTRLATPGAFIFTIEMRNPMNGALVGTSENIVGWCGGFRTPEFGYGIMKAHHRKGYATEAMRAALDAYWDTWPAGMPGVPPAQRLETCIKTGVANVASQGAGRKMGFRDAGEETLPEDGSPMAGARTLVLKMARPSPERVRAYETLQSVGVNLSEEGEDVVLE